MLKLQRDLQWEDKKKQQDDERKKELEGVVQEKKNKLLSLYQFEIDECNQVILYLKSQQERAQPEKVEEEEEEEEVKEIDGMKVLQKKKPLNNAQKNDKKKVKKVKTQTNASSNKIFLGLQVLQDFRNIGVNPPANIDQIPETIVQIQSKIDEYLKLRNEEVSGFDAEAVLSKILEEEKERREKRNQERKEEQGEEADGNKKPFRGQRNRFNNNRKNQQLI